MSSAHNAYLETQIFTATPQRLRLMLIEGGIRFITKAQAAYAEKDISGFLAAVARCRDIATELLVAIKPDGPEFTHVSRGIYAFVIRTLADVELQHDPVPLSGVLKVFEEERITWTQVCELQPHAPVVEGHPLGIASFDAHSPSHALGTSPPSSLSFDA